MVEITLFHDTNHYSQAEYYVFHLEYCLFQIPEIFGNRSGKNIKYSFSADVLVRIKFLGFGEKQSCV
jgi:hypothetical protein